MSSSGDRTTGHFGGLSFGGRLSFKNVFNKKQPSLAGDENTSSISNSFEAWSVDNKPVIVDLNKLKKTIKHDQLLVKDIVKDICKTLGIFPKSAGFFGINCENTWLVQTQLVDQLKPGKKQQKFLFKLQFKVLSANDLRRRDEKAYEYYIKQCRYDFKTGVLDRQLQGKDNEKILLRMVILEMMMVAKEEKISPLKDVMKNRNRKVFSMEEILRKYNDRDGPRDVSKCKQKVEKSLSCFSKVTEPDKDFITEVELLTNYKYEIFHVHKYERERTTPNPIEIWISPTDIAKRAVIGNVKMSLWSSPFSQFHRFKQCEFDNKKNQRKVTILRGQEPPEMIYCTDEQMESLFSFVDGYYQLLVNQYNSILYDSCEYLQSGFYHGPIEREVALRVLTSKGREKGTYLIRENTTIHGSYVLSLIKNDLGTDEDFSHLVINTEVDGDRICFKIDEFRKFESLNELQEFYKDEENSREIKTQLLKIITPKNAGDVPLYTDPSKFRPPPPSRRNPTSQTSMLLGPSLLDVNKMSMKNHIKNGAFGEVFKYEAEDHRPLIVKRFPTLNADMLNEVANVLMRIQGHEYILNFVGVSIIKDLFLAFEFLPQGSLEKYLENQSKEVTYGQLLKYLYQISDAVAHLHDKELIHADLRLGKFLMKDLNTIKLSDCCITWKLALFKKLDEKIFQKRFKHLAPEIFLQTNQAFTMKTDVWSYGLTIWQLFTLHKPFNNSNSNQLMQFFKKHMEMEEQPALLHLNMNILRYCPSALFDVFSRSLHMKEKDRGSMVEILKLVQEVKTKAASCHKDKLYFTYDWANDENMPEMGRGRTRQVSVSASDYDSIDSVNNSTNCSIISNRSSGGGGGGNGWVGHMANDRKIENGIDNSDVVMRNGLSSSLLLETPHHRHQESTKSDVPLEKKPTLKELDGDITEASVAFDAAAPYVDEKKVSLNSSSNIRSNDSTKIEHSTNDDMLYRCSSDISAEHMDVDNLAYRRHSHSAPSSPTRPKIFRSISLTASSSSSNDQTKREEEDLETASILVGMSKLHKRTSELPTSKNSQQTKTNILSQQATSKPPTFRVPPGAIVYRAVDPLIPGQPIRFFPSQTNANFMKGFRYPNPHRPPVSTAFAQIKLSSSPSSSNKMKEVGRRSPQPLPPDSPETVRRDFSDAPKREIPRDDKTRLFLQERINEERDRYRGKRSLSFIEEFDEYKNTTKKAAKMALVGPNPFNIGVKVPDNFLLPNDKRGFKANPIPSDVTRFFKRGAEARDNPVKNTSEDDYRTMEDLIKSRELQNKQLNSAQHDNATYKTAKELEILRCEKANATTDRSDMRNTYKPSQEEIQLVDEMKGMHAHSPKSVGYDETASSRSQQEHSMRQDSVRLTDVHQGPYPPETRLHGLSSATSKSTVPMYSGNPYSMSSLFMPSVHFPYARTDPGRTSSSIPLSSVPRPLATTPKLGYPHHHQHLQRYPRMMSVPVLTMNQFSGDRLPVATGKYSSMPPDLPRIPGPISSFSASMPYPGITVKTEPSSPNLLEHEIPTRQSVAPQIFVPADLQLFAPPVKKPPLKRHIKKEDLTIHNQCIGKGQFGTVHKGTWKFTDPNSREKREVLVAVKRLKKDTPLTQEAIEDLRKEADNMAILTNNSSSSVGANHIIKMYGVCDEQDRSLAFSIVTELALASLDDYISQKKAEFGRDGVGYCLFYAKQIANGMEHLHSLKVIHRDLACRNILVMQKELVKISDFGLSRVFSKSDYYRCSRERVVPYPWLAIESMEKQKYTVETDYWSYGITLWEMFTLIDENYTTRRAMPYAEENIQTNELLDYLVKGHRLAKPPKCPDKLWNEILLKCWDRDPEKRLSFYCCSYKLTELMEEIEFCLGD